MPKISIYLPDDLYDEVRQQDLPISALAQEAFRRALDGNANRDWVERARARAPRSHSAIDLPELMDDVRGEFGA